MVLAADSADVPYFLASVGHSVVVGPVGGTEIIQVGTLEKTVDCAYFSGDGSVVACCYGGVTTWSGPNYAEKSVPPAPHCPCATR